MIRELRRATMYSRDPFFQTAMPLGHWLPGGPALLDQEIFKGHGIFHGPPGAGKSVNMHNLVRQLAARQSPVYREFCERHGLFWEPSSIVYLNFVEGPDDREFNYLKECADIGGMKWKFFDARPRRASYVYNPLNQRWLTELGAADLAGHIIGTADLSQGEAYGVKYYGEKAEAQTIRLMEKRGRVRSYWDLTKLLEDEEEMAALKFSVRDRERGDQLLDHFTILGAIHPFNERPRHAGDRPEAFRNAIDVAEVFREPHLVFFNLDWIKGKRAHSVGKHILSDLDRVAQVLRKERRCHVYFIADEAWALVQSAGVISSLNTIRHRGISVVLASQHRKMFQQLRGLDLYESIASNVAWTIDLGLPTWEDIEWVQKQCPDDLQSVLSYVVEASPLFDRSDPYELSLERALAQGKQIQVQERPGPRYDKNTIIRLNMSRRVGWLRVSYNARATRIDGVAPFTWNYAMSQAEWDRYALDPLPPPGGKTILVEADPDLKIEVPRPAPRRLDPRAPAVVRPPNGRAASPRDDEALKRRLESLGEEP